MYLILSEKFQLGNMIQWNIQQVDNIRRIVFNQSMKKARACVNFPLSLTAQPFLGVDGLNRWMPISKIEVKAL